MFTQEFSGVTELQKSAAALRGEVDIYERKSRITTGYLAHQELQIRLATADFETKRREVFGKAVFEWERSVRQDIEVAHNVFKNAVANSWLSTPAPYRSAKRFAGVGGQAIGQYANSLANCGERLYAISELSKAFPSPTGRTIEFEPIAMHDDKQILAELLAAGELPLPPQ